MSQAGTSPARPLQQSDISGWSWEDYLVAHTMAFEMTREPLSRTSGGVRDVLCFGVVGKQLGTRATIPGGPSEAEHPVSKRMWRWL